MERERLFKAGDIVRHKDKSKKGLVMDIGVFYKEMGGFVHPFAGQIDSLKVWTEGGITEVWDIAGVELIEE